MNTATTTPPVLKTLFPLKENRHLVDKLAAKKGIRLFVFGTDILFEGTPTETHEMKSILVGGVTA